MKLSFKTIFGSLVCLSLAACAKPAGSTDGLESQPQGQAHLTEVTNYFIQSDCVSKVKEAAVRLLGHQRIREGLDRQGHQYSQESLHLHDFGFPEQSGFIGKPMEGFSSEGQSRKCVVRTTRANEDITQSQVTPASEGEFYSFAQPGYLTTTQYDCFENESYLCSITMEELPAGILSEIFTVAHPL